MWWRSRSVDTTNVDHITVPHDCLANDRAIDGSDLHAGDVIVTRPVDQPVARPVTDTRPDPDAAADPDRDARAHAHAHASANPGGDARADASANPEADARADVHTAVGQPPRHPRGTDRSRGRAHVRHGWPRG
jgi:hypothetical protein